MTFVEKLEYIARYRPGDGEDFFQPWPNAGGKFDPIILYREAMASLKAGGNPVVPAGVARLPLSELMAIRIEQERSVPISPELAEVLLELEETIQNMESV